MSGKHSVKKFLSEIVTLKPIENDSDYQHFVNSKEPLSELQQKDTDNWQAADVSHPILPQIPSEDREDYFDISYGSDPGHILDIYHLKGDKLRPVIFFIHGGGWIWFDKNQSRYGAPTWVSLGYTVVSINYTLANVSPHPAQIEDCARALKWVMDNINKYGGDPNNIAVVGQSAGGHLAALLVTGIKWHHMFKINMDNVKCWIPLSGIHDFNIQGNYYHPWMKDFTSALLDTPDKRNDASPSFHVTGKEPPSLIIHGGDDWLVPRVNSIELYSKLVERGTKDTRLEIVNGYWHCNTIVDYGEAKDEPTRLANKFLKKHLPTDGSK